MRVGYHKIGIFCKHERIRGDNFYYFDKCDKMTLMGKRFDFEYIVIGGGTTGKTTAINLAKMGQKVALVEQDRWGGNGLNYRDIPYGACLNFSHFYLSKIL